MPRKKSTPLHDDLSIEGPALAALMQLGFACFQQGKLQQARALFEGMLVLNPFNPYAYSVLGSIHQVENRFEEAVNCFSVALKLFPRDVSTLTNRGESLLAMGRLKEAAEDLRAAIELDPECEDPAANRARFLAAFTIEALELAEEKGMDAVQDAVKRMDQQLSA